MKKNRHELPAAPVAFRQDGADPYAWLRDRDDRRVLQHLRDENAYAEEVMRAAGPLRRRLYDEMLGRILQDDSSVPERHGNYFYYTRTEQGQAYPIHCRRRAAPEPLEEELLLDENAAAAGRDFFALGVFRVSPDHNLLAYAVDTEGNERYELHVKDLRTGELRIDVIPDAWSAEWANDNRTLYYLTLDDAHRPWRVWRHVLGSGCADELVYEESDRRFYLDLRKTRSERWIVLTPHANDTSEARVLDADRPDEGFRLIEPRRPGIEYHVDHGNDGFWVLTNEEAPNFRVMLAPETAPGRGGWHEMVPHDPDVLLQKILVFSNHLVLMQRRGGLRAINIRELPGLEAYDVHFDEAVYSVSAHDNPEFDTPTFRFEYSSPLTPPTVFDYDMRIRQRTVLKRKAVLGGFDPAAYRTRRIFAEARDGTRIPISLVYRRDRRRAEPAPLVLFGYGAYGICIEPVFDSTRLSLLDRGVIWAIAHVRGGEDLGRHWYEHGKLLHKRNSFTDFIACAETLIAQGWTASDRLAIRGRSAGGLLIGAVLNMRAELFRAAVAMVPFVDVMHTMLDDSLPLTVTEWDEWGDPRLPQHRAYIASYSPYDNVSARDYPPMLVTAGLNDPRVGYWEPAKWVARLRELKTDANPVLLRTDLEAGHRGPSGRYAWLEDLAFEYAFILDRLGITE